MIEVEQKVLSEVYEGRPKAMLVLALIVVVIELFQLFIEKSINSTKGNYEVRWA